MAKAGSDISELLRTAIVLLALVSWSRIATAQEMRAYIGGALTASSSGVHSVSGGSPSTTYENASTESWGRGVTGEAGWFFKRSLAIGVDVTVPFQRNDLTSVHNYVFNRYSLAGCYREETIFAVLHYQMGAARRIRTALVGGGGVVSGNALVRTAAGHAGSTSIFDPFGDEQSVSGHMFGITGGADLAIEASRHLAVVPQFRLLMIACGSIPKSTSVFAYQGLPSVVYRLGMSVRASF